MRILWAVCGQIELGKQKYVCVGGVGPRRWWEGGVEPLKAPICCMHPLSLTCPPLPPRTCALLASVYQSLWTQAVWCLCFLASGLADTAAWAEGASLSRADEDRGHRPQHVGSMLYRVRGYVWPSQSQEVAENWTNTLGPSGLQPALEIFTNAKSTCYFTGKLTLEPSFLQQFQFVFPVASALTIIAINPGHMELNWWSWWLCAGRL